MTTNSSVVSGSISRSRGIHVLSDHPVPVQMCMRITWDPGWGPETQHFSQGPRDFPQWLEAHTLRNRVEGLRAQALGLDFSQLHPLAAAAAAAKSPQLCPTPCDPRDGSPPGSAVPGILQARILEWVAISFSNA